MVGQHPELHDPVPVLPCPLEYLVEVIERPPEIVQVDLDQAESVEELELGPPVARRLMEGQGRLVV